MREGEERDRRGGGVGEEGREEGGAKREMLEGKGRRAERGRGRRGSEEGRKRGGR